MEAITADLTATAAGRGVVMMINLLAS